MSFKDVQNPCSATDMGPRQQTEGETSALFPFSFALTNCLEGTLQTGETWLSLVLTPHFCLPDDLSYGHEVPPSSLCAPGTTLDNSARNTTAYRMNFDGSQQTFLLSVETGVLKSETTAAQKNLDHGHSYFCTSRRPDFWQSFKNFRLMLCGNFSKDFPKKFYS